MLGNVWEWCADDLRKYGSDAVNDPVGSLVSAERALRGGSWFNYAYARDFPRAAIRLADDSGNWYSHFGIRCARVRE